MSDAASTGRANYGAAPTIKGQLAALGLRSLSLAATPVFAGMALLTARTADQSPFVCMNSAAMLGGMTTMYALMSLFHLASWLRLGTSPPDGGPSL
jgi:hypothetical protein